MAYWLVRTNAAMDGVLFPGDFIGQDALLFLHPEAKGFETRRDARLSIQKFESAGGAEIWNHARVLARLTAHELAGDYESYWRA